MSIKTPWMEVLVRVIAGIAIAVCTLLLLTEEGRSDDYATAAIGVFNSGKQSHAESKFLNVGHRDELGLGISYQFEAGGWTDSAGHGRSSSGYGAAQLGVQTDGPVYARVMSGPALITTPDAYLGGMFQMKENFYIGLHGNNGNSVGIEYMHISSAGIEQPNVGRDFMAVEVSIPW